tara:strand:- start:1935 stop:2267 length:333 start_codon:yes stop_codon:yes gene_type:complete
LLRLHTRAFGAFVIDTTGTDQSSPQQAIPGLPDHLVVAHILRSEYFGDPADLARLPAVSRAMRDAMAGTGLRFREIQRFTQATRAPSFLPIAVISNDTESIALREARGII